ncbi:MAG: DUF1850 domain-containing protein [Paracoccaceae bacterium]
MSGCLMAGTLAIALSGPAFTLHWTHSVEKVEWVEDWRVEPGGLRLTGAQVKGSGAGMEPGEGATLQDGWWIWAADRRVDRLDLAASGATGAGWRLCDGAECRELGAGAGEPVVLAPCSP